jgi:hypothetical protein
MHTLTNRLRLFAHEHDDVPAFHAAYLVATFLVAAVFSLGYFALLIALHMALDYVKYREVFHFNLRMTFRGMFLESVVDIALLLLALTFAVYLSNDLALVALGGLIRSELTIIRMLGTVLPKIRIFEHCLTIALDVHSYLHAVHPNLRTPLTRVQIYSLVSIGATGVLLLAAPIVFHAHLADLAVIVGREFALQL